MTRLDMAYVPVPTANLETYIFIFLKIFHTSQELVDLLKTKIHLSVSKRSLNSEELFVVFGS